ncbi:MAG: hypothetical protein ACOYJA_05230 [Christensenellales bacterium]|jgi:hypothetical protein
MKQAIKALFSLAMAAVLLAMGVGTAKAEGALAAPTIQYLPSDDRNMGKQVFVITNPNGEAMDVTWGSIEDGGANALTLGAGASRTVTLSDPEYAGKTLFVAYNDGEMVTKRGLSSYYVYVRYETVDGATLYTKTVTVEKSRGSVSVSAPATYEGYRLSGKSTQGHVFTPGASLSQRTLTFIYEEILPEPYTIRTVYTDADTGETLGGESINVPVDGSVAVSAPATLSAGGKDYALAAGQGGYTHAYGDSRTTYEFAYRFVPKAPDKAYSINIKFKDADTGAILASKNLTVPVGGTVDFPVPATYTTGDGAEYERAPGEPQKIVHAANNPARAYTVAYKSLGTATAPYTITIRYANALTGQILGSATRTVEMNGTVSFQAPATLSVGGDAYTLAAGQSRNIVHAFADSARRYTLYYNQAGAQPVEPYAITIRYTANDTNQTLYSATVNVPIQHAVYQQVPTEFVYGGNVYTLAAGQSAVIEHAFSDSRRVYNVFYKLAGPAEPETPPTEPEPPVVAPQPEPTPGPTAEPEVSGSPEASESPEVSPTPVVIEDEQVPLGPNASGAPQATDIPDEPVPLAAAQDGANAAVWWAISGGVIAAAAIAVIALLLIKRRKRQTQA